MSVPVPMYGFGDGGGTSLNFDVKAYATEEALLADTPKENTIGIITTNKITGWMFSATEPESPVEGMVYITTGTDSDIAFNALKKNGIQVYPLSAKQYVSGAWVDVTAMSYQGGEWHEWETKLYLFKEGDQCEDITGGWTTWGTEHGVKDNYLRMYHDNGNAGCSTNNKIDMSNYTKIYFDIKMNRDTTFPKKIGISTSKAETNSVPTLVSSVQSSTDDRATLVLDVSDISSGYVAGGGTWMNAYLYNCWLDK